MQNSNRAAQVREIFSARERLQIANLDYCNYFCDFFRLNLDYDLIVNGDITSEALLTDNLCEAKIIAKEDLYICGISEIDFLFNSPNPLLAENLRNKLKMKLNFNDGDFVRNGEIVIELQAEMKLLLKLERHVLNFLQRMSGICSYSRELNDFLQSVGYPLVLLPTRKTLWGPLDKRAALAGGGGSHRVNLSDAFLVKDTHLKIMNNDFSKIFDKILSCENFSKARFTEIEIENSQDAFAALEAWQAKGSDKNLIIMFDNMKPQEIRKTLDELRDFNLAKVFFEASGGINAQNILQYAECGVDAASMSALTGASLKDLSLKIS
jgi:nicotinate-nucleotide pyrophosphorylase (carboxylating)